MRELSTLALIAGLLALTACAVFVLEDRQMLVPPPDAAAEDFVRRLAANRPEQVRSLFSRRARGLYTEKHLEAWFRDIKSVTHPIEGIEGKDPILAEGEAWATVAVKGPNRTVDVRLGFVREKGLWKVDRLPGYDEFSP